MWNIMIIKVIKIKENSQKVQSLLTKYNCSIQTRLGLHEAGDICGTEGMIILRLIGEKSDMNNLETALNELTDVTAKMVNL